MTQKQRAYQKSLLRRLHTAPRYLHSFKDDPIAYRAWLKKHLHVDSSKDLPLDTLIHLVQYFEMEQDHPPENIASPQQIGFIRHLWERHATYKDETSLLHFIERTVKRSLTRLETLTPKEATQVIVAVKKLTPPKEPTFANNPNYKGD